MSAGRGRARQAPDDRREPSYDRDRQPPSRDRGRDRGGDRGYPDDYDRSGDREQDYDREQGRQDYDEWDRDEEYDDRDRSPPNTRGGHRPGYDRDDRRDGGRDDYYGRDSHNRDRGKPDFSKNRSSSMAEIARGMSERQELARCAPRLPRTPHPLASAEAGCPLGC